MSAKDVVAKAAEANIKLSEAHVYAIRSADKSKGKKKTKSAKSTPRATTKSTKKRSPKTRGPKPEKKSLVLSLVAANPTWTAEQIAKQAGCSVNYVYNLKRGGKGAPKAAKAAKAAKAVRGRPPGSASTNNATTEFYRVLKRIGVNEAKRLIANIEAYARA